MKTNQIQIIKGLVELLDAVMIDEKFSSRFAMQCRTFKRVCNNVLNSENPQKEEIINAEHNAENSNN